MHDHRGQRSFHRKARRHVCPVLASCLVTSSASVIEIGSKIDLLLFALRARFRFGRQDPAMVHIEWANERNGSDENACRYKSMSSASVASRRLYLYLLCTYFSTALQTQTFLRFHFGGFVFVWWPLVCYSFSWAALMLLIAMDEVKFDHCRIRRPK